MSLLINQTVARLAKTAEPKAQEQAKEQRVEELFKRKELDNSTVKKQEKDPDDDGKVSFFDGAKSFFSGMFNKAKDQVTSIVDSVKKNPLSSALTAGAVAGVGVLCAMCPPLAIGAGVVGVGIGAFGVVKEGKEIYDNIKDLSKSDTDEQTLKILEEMGANATEAGESALFAATSAAAGLSGARAVSTALSKDAAIAKAGFYVTNQEKIELTYQLLKNEAAIDTLNKAMVADGVVAEGVALDKLAELF